MALRKSKLGQKVRRLREAGTLSQKEMAERLGISASYLNLIEHDERPVTVALLLKLVDTFHVDLQELSDDSDLRLIAALHEVFADNSFAVSKVTVEEIHRLVGAAPAAARTLVDLYRAWRTARDDSSALSMDLPSGRKQRIVLPTEEARDFFETNANYFAAIEIAAETLASTLAAPAGEIGHALIERLKAPHGITAAIVAHEGGAGALRRFDPRTRKLDLSETLPRTSRNFHMAYQLGLIEAKAVIDQIIVKAQLSSPESETLCRIGLANYFAGAVLMPYSVFIHQARTARYDIQLLMHRFDVSFEQVAHRLSTLQQPGNAGIPFFFVRADIAGNFTKRLSAAGFYFTRFGGSCARFVVHEAFARPGVIQRQIAKLPDGSLFFALAQTLDRPAGNYHSPVSHHAVAIGCDIARAADLVYADGFDIARPEIVTEIGLGCRVCERADCRQRAFPPLQHRLIVDETVKGLSTYVFRERH